VPPSLQMLQMRCVGTYNFRHEVHSNVTLHDL